MKQIKQKPIAALAMAVALATGLAAGFAPGLTQADVKKNEEAKPDDWNRSIKLQPVNSGQQSNSVAAFTKENQLRCWQNGDLIVLENGWRPVDSSKGSLLSSGAKRLHAYDYGETFCIYLGG